MEKDNIGIVKNEKNLGDISKIQEKAKKMCAVLGINIVDFNKAYNETGDFLTAQLQATERKILSTEISNIITLNGNVIPEELYGRISKAANAATIFIHYRLALVQSITSLQKGDVIALSPLQIAQLLVNTSEEDKPLFSEEDKEIINDLAAMPKVYSAEEANSILRFLEMKRLSTRENTDLYNRVIDSLEHSYDYESLFTKEGTLIRVDTKKKQETKPFIKKIEFDNQKNKKARNQ